MIKEVFRIISIWVIVLPLIIGIINYRGLNRDSRWIFLLTILGLAPQILTAIIGRETPGLNTVYNLYTPAELGVFFMIFISKFERTSSQAIARISLVIYLFACLYVFLTNGIQAQFLNSLVCLNNIVYLLWILLALMEQYNAKVSLIQKGNPFAWYLFALIIYAPCTVLVFALYYYMRRQPNTVLMDLWIIQSICNILLYLLFSAGLFIRKPSS